MDIREYLQTKEKAQDQLDLALKEIKSIKGRNVELLYDYVFEAHILVKKLTILLVTVSLPTPEEIETLANNIIFISEEKMKEIEAYREGFIDGMTQLKDMISGNER